VPAVTAAEKKNGLQNRPHSMVLHTKASSESTLAGPPGPPVAFDVTSDALALSWDAPANTGGRAVRGYQVPLSRLSSRTNFSPHYHPRACPPPSYRRCSCRLGAPAALWNCCTTPGARRRTRS
jgi:hypothetical protein